MSCKGKVVCVKPGESSLGLKQDKIYTELDRYTSNMGEEVIEVLEAMPPSPYRGYRATRFRPATSADMDKVKEKEEISI